MKSCNISIVSPVYKAKNIIPELVRRIVQSVSKITEDFEVILVEDGCPENSWESIAVECKKDNRIKGIKLSRNFGQHHAITAGLDYVKGEWIVVIDCDLQDQPEEISSLYHKALEGFDIVYGARANREDSFFKIFLGRLFNLTYNWLAGTKFDRRIGNFGIYSKKVVEAYKKLREPFRLLGPIISWVGFKHVIVEIKHSSRFSGKTSYTFKKLINLSLDVLIAFSDKPLKLTIKLGFFISSFSIALSAFYLFEYVNGRITEPGYTSIILSLWLICGIIVFSIGIVGLYLSKIFTVVKNRPIYIVEDTISLSFED